MLRRTYRLFHLFDAALAASAPGSRDLTFLPLDGPAGGVFAGLSLAHTRADMSRAILEGAAFAVRATLDDLRGAAIRRIVLADYPSWAALGAAALAGWGVGAFPTLAAAVARLRPPVRRLEPDQSLNPTYAAAFARYQSLVLCLDSGSV